MGFGRVWVVANVQHAAGYWNIPLHVAVKLTTLRSVRNGTGCGLHPEEVLQLEEELTLGLLENHGLFAQVSGEILEAVG